MKIPIHRLLESLGIQDLVLDTPEDVSRVKMELDKVIKKQEDEKTVENK
ncbi:MAG: hypothetical protein HYY51_04720 [Candidatus Magasanikbacteria bacterium]|nr:hypothetical protein [Candidatus Magasanikbacteria bacterium]